MPQLREKVALALVDAEQLRDLAGDDREREPDDEPFITGSEMKLARKPSRRRPARIAISPTVMASVIVSCT